MYMPHFIYQNTKGSGGPERLFSEQEIVGGSSHEPVLGNNLGNLLKPEIQSKVSKANNAHYAAFHASRATKTIVIEVEDVLGPPCTHRGFKNKYEGERAVF